MAKTVYRYVFSEHVKAQEVEATLVLAELAVEALHGAARMKLDARHFFDEARRACAIDASNEIGEQLNRVFVHYLALEFGEGAVTVERVAQVQPRAPEPVVAGA